MQAKLVKYRDEAAEAEELVNHLSCQVPPGAVEQQSLASSLLPQLPRPNFLFALN